MNRRAQPVLQAALSMTFNDPYVLMPSRVMTERGRKTIKGSQAARRGWGNSLPISLQTKVAIKQDAGPMIARKKEVLELNLSRVISRGKPNNSITILMMGSVKRKCISEMA